MLTATRPAPTLAGHLRSEIISGRIRSKAGLEIGIVSIDTGSSRSDAEAALLELRTDNLVSLTSSGTATTTWTSSDFSVHAARTGRIASLLAGNPNAPLRAVAASITDAIEGRSGPETDIAAFIQVTRSLTTTLSARAANAVERHSVSQLAPLAKFGTALAWGINLGPRHAERVGRVDRIRSAALAGDRLATQFALVDYAEHLAAELVTTA